MGEESQSFCFWESLIDRRTELFVFCLFTNNFGPFHALLAGHAVQDVDMSMALHSMQAVLGPGNDERSPSLDNLMEVNIRLTTSIAERFESDINDFHSIISKEPDPEKLVKAFEKLSNSMKNFTVQAWEKAEQEAKSIIRQYPERIRGPAVRLFNAASDSTSSVSEQQRDASLEIEKAIEDTSSHESHQRIRNAVRRALSSNNSAKVVARDWIRSLYGHRVYRSGLSISSGSALSAFCDQRSIHEGCTRVAFQRTASGWEVCNAV